MPATESSHVRPQTRIKATMASVYYDHGRWVIRHPNPLIGQTVSVRTSIITSIIMVTLTAIAVWAHITTAVTVILTFIGCGLFVVCTASTHASNTTQTLNPSDLRAIGWRDEDVTLPADEALTAWLIDAAEGNDDDAHMRTRLHELRQRPHHHTA